jgi:hypothetical protein
VTRVARWFVFILKYQFGYILEGLAMANVSIFYDHMVYFMAIWYSLCPFD